MRKAVAMLLVWSGVLWAPTTVLGAQGNCRGKTGTLSDVASLVGYCSARDGHRLAFAFLMNRLSDPNTGHAIEAKMAVAVANYRG
jgi:D-alanyl-D-alanine carboxypeptidase/D-alanyl-D-alanine-endopeptidase (penicillin-binding protein 4)